MAKILSLRFKDTPEDQARAREIVEALRQNVIPAITTAYNSAGDVCWMCELCATTVPCADGDPLPDGWRMAHTPQGPGPICKACCDEEDREDGTDGSLKAHPTRTQDITLNMTCAGKGKPVLQSGDEEDIEDGER